MNYLVTGGNGYIGSHLIKHLHADPSVDKIYAITRQGSANSRLPSNDRIIRVEYDGSAGSLYKAVEDSDRVAHLGALYTTSTDEGSVARLVEANIEFSVNLFHAISVCKPEVCLVSTSTFSAFDGEYRYRPQSFYAATKAAVEILAEGFPIRTSFLRLPDTYGPGDWRNKVHNILKTAIDQGELTFAFKKPHDQVVNLIHVEDVVRAILHTLRLLENEDTVEQPFDLFYPQNTMTLGEMVEIVIKNSLIGVSFPLFGEVTPIPTARHLLPLFELENNPHHDLYSTLFGNSEKQ